MKKLFIAGNFHQFNEYITQKIAKIVEESVYIADEVALHGYTKEELETIKFIGTWNERKDVDAIEAYLRAHNVQAGG